MSDTPKRPNFHAGHAIALHMVIVAASQLPQTGDEKADSVMRNALIRADEVRQWLEPLVHADSPAAAPQRGT